ncbi:MAG: HDOD domain-containing protein [Clostridiales Family XIII bacterium]|nr:HDOD domain-containing protein [Clostridiales Family XIII bacterium]
MENFVARQPIFNRNNEVIAYELLYRKDKEKNSYDESVDPDQATRKTIINSFVEIGLEKLTNGKKAYVNFTERHILDNMASLLPPDMLVVEILENIKPTDEVLNACMGLKNLGFNIALDDFIICDENFKFLEYADIVKVDFLSTDLQVICDFVNCLKTMRSGRSGPIHLLAEKIEDDAMYRKAIELGFHYFQGYFFSRPVIVAGRSLRPLTVNRFRLLKLVMTPDFDYHQLSEVIRQDVALSYRLLRLVNSAYFAFSTTISNIRQALVILGMTEVKKWVALMCLMEINPDKTAEITRMSLVRARFLERIAPLIGMRTKSETLYLIGMFSMIDVIMESPMEEIMEQISLDEDVSMPLIEKSGVCYELLKIIIYYEKGDFEEAIEQARICGLCENDLTEAYMEAVQWSGLLGI